MCIRDSTVTQIFKPANLFQDILYLYIKFPAVITRNGSTKIKIKRHTSTKYLCLDLESTVFFPANLSVFLRSRILIASIV